MGNRQSAQVDKKNSVGPYGEEIGNLFEKELYGLLKANLNTFYKSHKHTRQTNHKDLCDIGVLCQVNFEKQFEGPSQVVTRNLFERFFIDLLNSDAATKNLFIGRVQYILEIELERIINECEAFGLLLEHDDGEETPNDCDITNNHTTATDSDICKNIFNTCISMPGENLREKFISWCIENCPKMFNGLQSWILYKFTKVKTKGGMEMIPLPLECETSKLQLNGSLLWFLCCVLPSCFTRMENKFKLSEDSDHEVDEETKYTWNLLYDSNQHGLSLNRFKHKVMSYKSPTVSIIEFSRGLKVILALDEPWVDSPEKFGGPYCMLIEISPAVKIIEADSKMVYLKELGRSIPTGLSIGSDTRSKISINKDLSTAQVNYKHLIDENIERIEVWGCGGVEAINSQADMKKWERKEIEKRKKVKLPGQWDQDKTILEMGGVTVNHSQRGDF